MAQYMRGNETVFETPDVERTEGPAKTVPIAMPAEGAKEAQESIDPAHIQPEQSFEVFQGKVFTLSTNEYSIADRVERRVESPLQRFVRLRQEMAELKSDLDIMASGVDGKLASSSVWAALQAEAGSMLQGLQMMETHAALQKKGGDDASRLTAQLREVAAGGTAAGAATASAPRNAPPASVDAVLEQRLCALETLLGSSSSALDIADVLSGNNGDYSGIFPLADAIARMEKRVEMLDSDALEQLRTKTASLRAELEATNREKNKNMGPEQKVIESVAKLDDLYKKLQLADGVSHDLPALVIRLRTLQHLHSETAKFSTRVAALETVAEALESQTSSNSAVLQDVKEGLTSNIATMLDNIDMIDKRIAEIQKK